MIERIEDLPAGIVGVKASGRASKEDYQRAVVPLLEAARKEGTRLRILCEVGPDFVGFTPSGAWEDVKLGLQNLRRLAGCAVITDVAWMREATRLAKFMMPCPMEAFSSTERTRAIEWLGALPEGAAVSHRLVPETGVLVVDVTQPLRSSDFDALAATADAWIEAHGDLAGLVMHTREFPGWENLGGLVSQVKFVRDHHRKVKRVALATDFKLVELVPRLAAHFIKAEVKTFAYDDVDAAIAWAAGR